MNDLKLECLNAAGFSKPQRKDFLQAVEDLLKQYAEPCTALTVVQKKLIGLILRRYETTWPKYRTQMHDLDWLAQAFDPKNRNTRLDRIYKKHNWLFCCDGRRVHKIDFQEPVDELAPLADVSDPGAPNFNKLIPPDLKYTKKVLLSDFRQVQADLVAFNGFTYELKHILEAFSGNPIMFAAEASDHPVAYLHIQSPDEKRIAMISPLRS